jgi:uncharacterized protein YecE (DUF72 family)
VSSCLRSLIVAQVFRLAPCVYVRRHGTGPQYGGSYPEARLKTDTARIRTWLADGLDVYVYFNNDRGGAAVRNALRLRRLLGRERQGIVSSTK